MVQWLRLLAPSAGGLGSIPGQATRFHTPQPRVHMSQLKILNASAKTRHSQISKERKIFFFLNKAGCSRTICYNGAIIRFFFFFKVKLSEGFLTLIFIIHNTSFT